MSCSGAACFSLSTKPDHNRPGYQDDANGQKAFAVCHDKQHFKILREAGLVHSERKGVEMHNTTRRAELEERFGDMLSAILNTLHRSEFATASIRACASADGSLEPSVSSREGKKRAGSQSRQCKRSGTR